MNDLRDAVEHFKNVDPIMYELAMQYQGQVDLPEDVLQPDAYFRRICRTIAGQQLSVKASSTIWGRVQDLIGVTDGELFGSDVFDKHSDDDLRACGLSYPKIKYIRAIAASIKNNEVDLDALPGMTNSEVVKELTKLMGLGVWSVEMFLMTALARRDVFSVGDLGLVTGVEKAYGIGRKDKVKIAEAMKPLSPHRTVASLLLWRSLDSNTEQ